MLQPSQVLQLSLEATLLWFLQGTQGGLMHVWHHAVDTAAALDSPAGETVVWRSQLCYTAQLQPVCHLGVLQSLPLQPAQYDYRLSDFDHFANSICIPCSAGLLASTPV